MKKVKEIGLNFSKNLLLELLNQELVNYFHLTNYM